jgi:hypothetical protein
LKVCGFSGYRSLLGTAKLLNKLLLQMSFTKPFKLAAYQNLKVQ